MEGTKPPLDFALVAGGRSNLTYRVTDAAGKCLGAATPPCLPRASDRARHGPRAQDHVQPRARPTCPFLAPSGCARTSDVNGAPFYVMEFVDGFDPPRRARCRRVARRGRKRHVAGESMADTLAKMHAVDVDAVGLGDFARRDGYAERQLKRWLSQFESSPVEGSRLGRGRTRPPTTVSAAAIPEQIGTHDRSR